MKLTKTQNPHNFAVGQVWKRAKRNDRPNKFAVISFEKSEFGIFAVVEYGKGKTAYRRKINLLNFKDYKLIK